MSEPPGPYPEKQTAEQRTHDLVMAAAEVVPWFGGFISYMVDNFWRTNLEHRQVEWFTSVGEALQHAVSRINGLEDRLSGDEFLTLFMKASRAASETHETETREALKNAVLNAALEHADEDWSYVFIELAGRLRPAHLQLLAFAMSPSEYINNDRRSALQAMGKTTSIYRLVEEVFPSWSKIYYRELKTVLESEGLAELQEGPMSWGQVLAPRLTDKGHRFIQFITAPEFLDA